MQLDLLNGVGCEAAPAEEIDRPIAKPMDIGQRFELLLTKYEAGYRAWVEMLGEMSAEELRIIPCESYMQAIRTPDASDTETNINKVARDIKERMIRYAEKKFAPPGQSLNIDRMELPDQFHIERRDERRFAPSAFWKYLEKQYGGSAGEDLAWKQAAEEVVKAFNLCRSDKVETKGGYVILRDSIIIDSTDKKFFNKIKPCYHSQESIRECCRALGRFAAWAGLYEVEKDLEEVASHFCFHHYQIESRKQFKCGNGEIVVVTFQTNFEYRLSLDTASQLQLFIGTYAPNSMRD